MAASDDRNGARRTGDTLDRLIDEAVEDALRAGPVDLRVRVLETLDRGGVDAQGRDVAGERRPRLGWLMRPALLPAAGALVMVAAVGLLWQHANEQLSGRPGRVVATARTAVARTAPPGVTQQRAAVSADPASDAIEKPGAEGTASSSRMEAVRAGSRSASLARNMSKGGTQSDSLLAAASLLEMDAATAPKAAVAPAFADESAADALYFPGAPVWAPGDTIAPMPKPRPIQIPPLATPPIVDAPPISTLGKPVSTLADETGRERQEPGKPGGKNP